MEQDSQRQNGKKTSRRAHKSIEANRVSSNFNETQWQHSSARAGPDGFFSGLTGGEHTLQKSSRLTAQSNTQDSARGFDQPRNQQIRLSNASSARDQCKRSSEMTITNVLNWNKNQSTQGSQLNNLRRRARPGRRARRAITQIRAKTFHRASNEQHRQGGGSSGQGSPQNIKIIKPDGDPGAQEPTTQYEVVAGTSSTLHPMNTSKETSGELPDRANFIQTSTLTWQQTGTGSKKAVTTEDSVAAGYGLQKAIETQIGKVEAILPRNSSKEEATESQDGVIANVSVLKFPKLDVDEAELAKVTRSDEAVGMQEFTILEQNDHSCLDLDAKQMEETSIVKDVSAFAALNENEQDASPLAAMHQSQQSKKVPVTTIDFREARQYRRQRSGVENPHQSRITYKLPSYASCLRAQIRPKNYTALREYYELLAKDEKLAKINERFFLQDLLKQENDRSHEAHQNSMKRQSIRNEHKAFSVMEGASKRMKSHGRYHERKEITTLHAVQERRKSSGKESQAEASMRKSSVGESEPDEIMQGVLDQSPQQDKAKGNEANYGSKITDINQVTYIQYGSKQVKYQMAFSGPEDAMKDPSEGTFVQEGDGSRKALSGQGDPNSTIRVGEKHTHSYHYLSQKPASIDAVRAQSTLNGSYKASQQMHKSLHPSDHRFGLGGKVTDVMVNTSSQLLGAQNRPKKYATMILEPVLTHTRVATAGANVMRFNKDNSPARLQSSLQEREKMAKGRVDLQSKIISRNGSENNLMATQSAAPVSPDSHSVVQKLKTKTTHDVTKTADCIPYIAYKSISQQKKSNTKSKNVAGQNEDLQQIKERRDINQNTSGKKIEIAIRTDGIFSSHHDDDDELILDVQNENSKQSNQQPMVATLPQNQNLNSSRQDELQKVQARVITYRMPQGNEHSMSQIGSATNKNVSDVTPGRLPVQQIFSSQGFSTMRNMNSSAQNASLPRLQQTQNITAVEIKRDGIASRAQERTLQQATLKTGTTRRSHETQSEVRRQQIKHAAFSKVHNRMISQSPDEEGEVCIAPMNRNEAQTQVQVMFSSNDSHQTRGDFIGDLESVQIGSNVNSVEKQQLSSSHLEGTSVCHNSHTKITHHQHSGRMNINESEMLKLLDMCFGATQTPGGASSNKGGAVSPKTYSFTHQTGSDFVQQLQTKQYQLPIVRSRGGSQMQPKAAMGKIKLAANRATLQHQRRSLLNKKQQKTKTNESFFSSSPNANQQNRIASEMAHVSLTKNLLQGKGGKVQDSSFDKTSQQAWKSQKAGDNFLKVKQIKPVKQESNICIESNYIKDTEPQLTETVIMRNSGGIKVAHPSVHLMTLGERTNNSLESLHYRHSTQSAMMDSDISPQLPPPKDQGKFDQVVIPSVPNSSSQSQFRQEQRRHTDFKIEQEYSGLSQAEQAQRTTNTKQRELSKFVNEKLVKHNAQRVTHSSVQHSQEDGKSPSRLRKLRGNSGQTHSTVVKQESPQNNTTKLINFDALPILNITDNEEGGRDSQFTHYRAKVTNPSEYNEFIRQNQMNLRTGAHVISSENSDMPEKSKQTHTNCSLSVNTGPKAKIILEKSVNTVERSSEYQDLEARPNSGETIQNSSMRSPLIPMKGKFMTPEMIFSGRETTHGSVQLMQQTPEFLQALNVTEEYINYALPSLATTSNDVSNQNSKDLHAYNPSTENEIQDKQKVDSTSAALNSIRDIKGVIQNPVDPSKLLSEQKAASTLYNDPVQTIQSEVGMSERARQKVGTPAYAARDQFTTNSSLCLKQPINVQIENPKAKQNTNSAQSVFSSGVTTNVAPSAIYLSGKSTIEEPNDKISIKDCTLNNQQHAANLLQAYWPYFSGFSTSMVTSAEALTSQRRPQTQQQAKHVPIQQFPGANGTPYQQHQRLMTRKRTNPQIRTQSKSGKRTPKAKLQLNATVGPRQPTNVTQGWRFSQTGLNDGAEQTKQAPMGGTQVITTNKDGSSSQNKITVFASASPQRGGEKPHERCQPQDFILPPGIEALSRDFNAQLQAIQTALKSSQRTDDEGSRVIGVVGEFATLQDQPEQSRNAVTKTMSIGEEVNDTKFTQARVYTFGPTEKTNSEGNEEPDMKEGRERRSSDKMAETEPSQQDMRNMQMTQKQMDVMDVHFFDSHELNSATTVQNAYRNSLADSAEVVHLATKEEGALAPHVRHASQPLKPRTSQQKTRFSWQVRENGGQGQAIRATSSLLAARRVLEKGLADHTNTIKVLQKQQERRGRRRPRIAEAYISYAMRQSSNESKHKERLTRGILSTHEQGTDMSGGKIESDLDRPSTVLDSQALNSQGFTNAYGSFHAAPDKRHGASHNSIKSESVDLIKSSSMMSALGNPYEMSGRDMMQSLTTEEIEQKENLEAAFKVQSIMEDMHFLHSLPSDTVSKLRNAAQKELAASISQIYKYGRRKPFNISNLQGQTEKRLSITGYTERKQQRKAEATFLKKQMGESFYSKYARSSLDQPSLRQKMTQTQPQSQMARMGDPYGSMQTSNKKKNSKQRRTIVQITSKGHIQQQTSIDSVNSSYQDHNQTSVYLGGGGRRSQGITGASVRSSGSGSSDESSLIIRGQVPSTTQHQSYMVPKSGEKFITVHDQRSESHLNKDLSAGPWEPQYGMQHQQRHGLVTAGTQSGDMERVAIRLVQQRDQSTENSKMMMGSHEHHDSMQSNEETKPLQMVTQSTLVMRPNTMHSSVKNRRMRAQIVTTEYSQEKNSTREQPQSPDYHQHLIQGSESPDEQQHFVMLLQQAAPSSDQKESGNNTIRAEDHKICFDSIEWRRTSTAFKQSIDEVEYSSQQQRISGQGEVRSSEVPSLMGRSMEAMGYHIGEAVEAQRLSAPHITAESQVTLKMPGGSQTQKEDLSVRNADDGNVSSIKDSSITPKQEATTENH